MYVRDTSCCGLVEFEDIRFGSRTGWTNPSGTPEQTMKIYAEWLNNEDGGIDTVSTVVFTDIDDPWGRAYKFGDALRKFIRKNKLGSVIATKPVLNANSGNLVKAYLWRVNVRAFNKKYRPDFQEDKDEYEEDIW